MAELDSRTHSSFTVIPITATFGVANERQMQSSFSAGGYLVAECAFSFSLSHFPSRLLSRREPFPLSSDHFAWPLLGLSLLVSWPLFDASLNQHHQQQQQRQPLTLTDSVLGFFFFSFFLVNTLSSHQMMPLVLKKRENSLLAELPLSTFHFTLFYFLLSTFTLSPLFVPIDFKCTSNWSIGSHLHFLPAIPAALFLLSVCNLFWQSVSANNSTTNLALVCSEHIPTQMAASSFFSLSHTPSHSPALYSSFTFFQLCVFDRLCCGAVQLLVASFAGAHSSQTLLLVLADGSGRAGGGGGVRRTEKLCPDAGLWHRGLRGSPVPVVRPMLGLCCLSVFSILHFAYLCDWKTFIYLCLCILLVPTFYSNGLWGLLGRGQQRRHHHHYRHTQPLL